MRPSLPRLIAIVLLLAGCQATPPPGQQNAAPPKAAEATEMRDTVQQPIDKAKATEDATLKAAEEQRKQIEDAGG